MAIADRVPVPDLLAVRDLVEDAARDLRYPAGLVAGDAAVRQFLGAVPRRRRLDHLEQLRHRPRQHAHRHGARHDVRLLDRPLPHRRREFRDVGPVAAAAAADRHRLPDLPALRQARAGRHLCRADPALHRLQPALRDLDDARLHPGHPARARGIRAGRRLHALAGAVARGPADGAQRHLRHRRVHLRLLLERVPVRAGADAHARS